MTKQTSGGTEFKDLYFNFLGALEILLGSHPPAAPDVIIDLIRGFDAGLRLGIPASHCSLDLGGAARAVLREEGDGAAVDQVIPYSPPLPPHARGATVIPFHTLENWVNEVKTATLCSEHVVAEDPFIHTLVEYEGFRSAKKLWGDFSPVESLLPEFREILEAVSQLSPFVAEGILEFRPFAESTQQFHALLDEEVQRHLAAHMEIGEVNDGYPFVVKIKVPRIGFDGWVEYGRDELWYELGFSFRDQMIRRMKPHLAGGTHVVCVGLAAAVANRGTFWTGSSYYWTLAGAPTRARADVRSHCFVHELVQPHLDDIDAETLIAIRRNEISFHNFRRRINEMGGRLVSEPGSSDFSREAAELYDYEFRAELLQIRRAYEKHATFKWAALYSGAVAISFATSHSVLAAVVDALKTLPTFLPPGSPKLAPDITDKAAMVLWELGKRT